MKISKVLARADSVAAPDTRLAVDRIEQALQGWFPEDMGVCGATMSINYQIPEAERQIVAKAVHSRRAEFVGARWCAHRALEQIQKPAAIIRVGVLGGPVWPQGVIGSITHESGMCLAAVMRSSTFSGLGIDLFDACREIDIAAIADLFMSESDRQTRTLPLNRNDFLRLVFSAKESVVKALSKAIGRLLDLREISLLIGADSFSGVIRNFPVRVAGHWTVVAPYFLTLAVIENER